MNPYAWLSTEIEQSTDSLEENTVIVSLEVAEMFGNIGGFWVSLGGGSSFAFFGGGEEIGAEERDRERQWESAARRLWVFLCAPARGEGLDVGLKGWRDKEIKCFFCRSGERETFERDKSRILYVFVR